MVRLLSAPVKPTGKAKSKQAVKLAAYGTAGGAKSATAGVLKHALDEAKEFYGAPDICTASESERLVAGVPFPSFCLEYLFGQNVLALGRVMQMGGVEGVGKSGFCIEMARWFIESGGLGTIIEAESKYSPDWAISTVGPDNADNLGVLPAESVNEWQHMLQFMTNRVKLAMLGSAKDKGPGMVYPALFVVDTIMGKSMVESQERVLQAGFADRDHPVEASSITKWLRTWPTHIAQWPFLLLLVNQEKPKKDEHTQATVRERAGGRQKEFQATYDVSLARINRLATNNYDGLLLQLRCHKSSLATTDRRLDVEVRWWSEPSKDGSKPVQTTVWDWHAATARLLTVGLPPTDRSRIADFTDFKRVDGGGYHSKRLGVSDKAPVDGETFGRLIMQDEELLRQLRVALDVKIRLEFCGGGVDWRTIRHGKLVSIGRKLNYKKKKKGR